MITEGLILGLMSSVQEKVKCVCMCVWFVLSPHMREWSAGLQACADPVLMFNACLRAEHAYYRPVKATVAFLKVWAVYTVLHNLSCITITRRGGWCGWRDVCRSNVRRVGPAGVSLRDLRVRLRLQLWTCSCAVAVVVYVKSGACWWLRAHARAFHIE